MLATMPIFLVMGKISVQLKRLIQLKSHKGAALTVEIERIVRKRADGVYGSST